MKSRNVRLGLLAALWLSLPQFAAAEDLASAGPWRAIKDGGTFADVANVGAGRVALVLPEGTAHFVLRLTHPSWQIQPGTAISLHLIFAGGDSFLLPAMAGGQIIQADITDSQVASWTHNFTAMRSVVVSFGEWAEGPWVVSLVGTTPTVTAMALSIEAAGITGLPWPWSRPSGAQAAIPGPPALAAEPSQGPAPEAAPEQASAPPSSELKPVNASSPAAPPAAAVLSQQEAPLSSSTEPLPSQPPDAQLKLAALIDRYSAAYEAAANDMAAGALRPQRAQEICSTVPLNAKGWVGTVSRLSANNDGKGVLTLHLSSSLSVGTTNNDFSDRVNSIRTLIPVGSAVHSTAIALREGQLVAFSGTFAPSNSDCFQEQSLIVHGAMTDPEFLFQFSSIHPIR